jgi:uncharacterized membrane protein YidH (DUF202 family)
VNTDKHPTTTDLALQRNRLAYERTKKASERTLMAWIRTALSMISFGFSIDTFFRAFIRAEQGIEARPLVGPAVLGLVLVGLGTLVLLLGTIDHYRFLRTIQEHLAGAPRASPRSSMVFIAFVVILIGMAIFAYLLYQSI